MDDLADTLGVEFKPSKDEGFEIPLTSLEFLGITVSTTPVQAHPTRAKLAALRPLLLALLNSDPSYHTVETVVGKLAFIG